MKRLILTTCAALSLATAAAHAETAGTIVSVAGEEGSVVVLRNGETLPATPNLELAMDDRLIVRADGGVDVSAPGCEVSLKAPAMAVVNSRFCNAQPIKLDTASTTPPAARAGGNGLRGSRFGVNSTTATLGGAGLGTVAVAAAAVSGGDSDSTLPLARRQDIGTVSGDEPVGNGSGTVGGPTAGNIDDAFDAGSGLDDGLFGFFEATSS